ncbi:hypothetical protein CFBP5875_07015 [Agrobacterium pusense]|nr:hypothetical protein [Agrobacterium pusense]PZU71988.1 MAG: hypothetical protein DI546_14790 [Rhizobium sp.]QBJ13066.1 hypothetical protein EYD00_06470 [Agrobacterium sp. 33MFTa1.1]QSZ56916.1 hypothetical protein BTN45_07220 [Rhizobium sp. ZX09]RAL98653.1 hypothetical protein DOU54_06155 [Agrobacterium sp. MS2]RSC38318.1 hypothetical protein EGT36_14820 [Agrobacterium sp. FDAARGOS_525]TGR71567.1 hypothetical protein EN837_09230 [bacterium M00.F.Ca.ET.194.01.1.1]TGS56423.1 hypothetical pro
MIGHGALTRNQRNRQMFVREKQSTSAKISVISTAWTVLVIAMVATTFSLYEQKPEKLGPDYPQLTARYQYMNYY